jgi:hypothetical protein
MERARIATGLVMDWQNLEVMSKVAVTSSNGELI